jgi:ketosteroid isomerase-like protein
VSRENVEIVRRAIDSLNRGDWRALAELCDREVEFCDLRSAVDTPPTLHGLPAVRTLLTDSTGAWSTFGAELLRCTDADPWVICDVRWYGTGRETGVPIDVRQVDAYELREGRIIRVSLGYADTARATQALGLE